MIGRLTYLVDCQAAVSTEMCHVHLRQMFSILHFLKVNYFWNINRVNKLTARMNRLIKKTFLYDNYEKKSYWSNFFLTKRPRK